MGSVLRGFVVNQLRAKRKRKRNEKEGEESAEGCGGGYDIGDVADRLKGASVFSFRDGIAEITKALEGWLNVREGVEMFPGIEAKSLKFDRASNTFDVRTFSHFLST